MQASTSLLSPIGYQSSDCGYCKSGDDTSASYYARCTLLSVETYQALVDRGWRRSGALLYKPDVFRACCPHYTIRLPAASLKTSRDQRQALNRWNTFVLGDDYIKDATKRFPKSKEEKARQKNGFDLLHTVHEAEVGNLKPIAPAHRFEVTLESDTFTEEKFLLYKDYQIRVHHDRPEELSSAGFKRFLCSSPLQRLTRQKAGKNQRLGSFHQCYRLDGRLIAIGVLDLLPHAVSGVYFIYHSDFEKWSFGKLSAMRETALALEGDYEYYYMGYYIHNCVKMRYKGDYKPQHILDPETYTWDPLDDELRGLFDRQKYVSLSRERKELASETDDNDQKLEYSVSSPKEAANSGTSLITLGMPGLLDAADLEKQVNLDRMRIAIGGGKKIVVKASDLQSWEEGDIEDTSTLKGLFAEFAACVGPIVAKDVIMDFSR